MSTTFKEKLTESARRHWQEFSQSRPGRRFQDRYRRRQESQTGRRIISRIFNITLGVLLVASSALGGLLPVLGWGTAIIGFSLIAGEVLSAALLLDKTEKNLWSFTGFCKDVWLLTGPMGKALIVFLLTVLTVVSTYLMYLAVLRIF